MTVSISHMQKLQLMAPTRLRFILPEGFCHFVMNSKILFKLTCYYLFQSLDAKAQKALECPCIADLRNGPCGAPFSEAFLCFLKSTSEEKVTFSAMQKILLCRK